MSKADMEKHADRYSKAFNMADYEKLKAGLIPEKDMWKYSSYWYKNFDGMAFKTVIRQLLSKWGILSIEMQEAYSKDMAVMHENGDYEYVDNAPEDEDNTKQNNEKDEKEKVQEATIEETEQETINLSEVE